MSGNPTPNINRLVKALIGRRVLNPGAFHMDIRLSRAQSHIGCHDNILTRPSSLPDSEYSLKFSTVPIYRKRRLR